VHGFALPLQSHALTYLLNVPEAEASTYIRWGINALLDGGDGRGKGLALDEYLRDRLARAAREPGPDFFGELTRLRFRGRPLTHDEILGFANLTFAGGRETVIQTIAVVFAHFAEKPDDLNRLRAEPDRITHAAEEFFRVASPLTQIGRVCPRGAQVHGVTVPPDHRVSLCWASANRDEAAFPSAHETRLDRRPNPHVAFGFGPHLCLGAPHARLLVRTLLEQLAAKIGTVSLVEAVPHLETEQSYTRRVGFDSLKVRLLAR
jgi:cytochrome P450